jgi:hypothetical protein
MGLQARHHRLRCELINPHIDLRQMVADCAMRFSTIESRSSSFTAPTHARTVMAE